MGTFTGGGVGNLTHDPEYKQFDNGEMCTLRVAFNDSYKDRNQQKVEVTTYLDCIVNGGAVSACMNSLRKGSKIYVTGTLAEDNWQDRETGKQRNKHKLKRCHVEFLDPNPNSGGGGYSNQGQNNQNQGFGGGQQQQSNQNRNQGFGGGQQQQQNNNFQNSNQNSNQNRNQNFGGGQQQQNNGGNRQFPPVDGGGSPRKGYDGGMIPPDGMSADELIEQQNSAEEHFRRNVGDNTNFTAPVPPPQLPRGEEDELPF